MSKDERIHINMDEETYEALQEEYPYALTDAEMGRMAINDALTLRERLANGE